MEIILWCLYDIRLREDLGHPQKRRMPTSPGRHEIGTRGATANEARGNTHQV